MRASFPALHGAAIYNPGLLSKQELLQDFIARQSLLERLINDCKDNQKGVAPQHHLLLGLRGMGKTTMLHRLRYAFEDDPQLTSEYLPLIFPEEQYNIAHLSDLWLNCLDTLSDTREQTQGSKVVSNLNKQIDKLSLLSRKDRAEPALDLLLEISAQFERRFVLLIDNFDMVLERLSTKEQWAFRKLLSEESSLLVIGASAQMIEVTYEYNAPFYDFFRTHELTRLNEEEIKLILLRLAKRRKHPEVKKLVIEQPERISTLSLLTGGNPRTIAMLYGILAEGTDGDVRSDLEKLLDNSTPLYKARLETLSKQAQLIVHELALHWDPVTAGTLAERASLKNQTTSSQLERLYKQGIVEKVPYYDRKRQQISSKTGYQIAERFFNIWYLMRASRRVRQRLLWLVKFLQSTNNGQKLELSKFFPDTKKNSIQIEKIDSAIKQLEESQTQDQSRPLYEALLAIKGGTRNTLLTVAPEIRELSNLLLDKLMSKKWGHKPINRKPHPKN